MTIKTITQDTPVSTLPSMIISSQVGHSYYPVTASPVCEQSSPVRAGREIGLPGYDGRMTTNSSTSRPAPADARATTFDEWITTELKINSGELLIMDDGSIMSWIDLDAASTRYAARLARVAAVLAACPDDTAL